MPRKLVSDELWSLIEPLLPEHKPTPKGGRPRISDRAALTGIIFVLKTGIPWEDLPQEMGCGSGMTCWRRLRDWQKAGVWEKRIGKKLVFGRNYTILSCKICIIRKRSTGAEPVLTALSSRQKGGRTHRTQPRRSRSPWKQTSYHNGSERHSACCRPHCRQCS